ncbi:MAG: histone deacetylase [Candidatus Aminicenantes bacterium]|nr:histone deacetylase [Candidatus Aminicenantes bacterium]
MNTRQKNNHKTGYVSHKIYQQHVLSPGHPESPARLQAIEKILDQTGMSKELKHISPKKDPFESINEIHSSNHIRQVQTIPVTGRAAARAVSGVLEAVDAVCQKTVNNVFCAVRPPGHHAQNAGHEEGFCFYNNVAVASRYIQKKYHLQKILIIDWDYHHGNGTEAAFYKDPSVLFFSTHDWYAYPGTGDPSRTGDGKGSGFNINAHLPPGSGDDAIKRAWDKQLWPLLDDFNPDFILISAGFDSRKQDLLGCFSITDQGFSDLTQMGIQIADQYCDGRLVSLLEGGYNPQGLAKAVAAHIKSLILYA